MKKLFILWIGIFCTVSVIASDHLLTLDQQIPCVKEYIMNLEHPRLLLGVGNVLELNGNHGDNPFLNNPNDILVDHIQKPGILVNRSLTVDFNDLAQLKKLAEAFADIFVVITTDLLVTKYASCWTKDNLAAFKHMLKPGGLLFMPIDSDSSHMILQKADTVENLFKQASDEMDLKNSTQLLISGRGWIVEYLPLSLAIPIDPQMQQEIDRKVEECKKARPHVNAWISSKRPLTKEAPLKEEFSKNGLDLDLELVRIIMLMPQNILNDDHRLPRYVADRIIAPKKKVVQKELSDKFMEEYVIPLNLRKIFSAVFNLQQIVIKKNLGLPQPHRKPTFADFSISATK